MRSQQGCDWVRVVWRGEGAEAAGGGPGAAAQQEHLKAKKASVQEYVYLLFLKYEEHHCPFQQWETDELGEIRLSFEVLSSRGLHFLEGLISDFTWEYVVLVVET